MFLLRKLPSAYFSGVRLQVLDEKHCVTSVPFKWFSQNPFRSTYFACLSMAAEMSTGLLALARTYRSHPTISMLIVRTEANYFKKAVGTTIFACEDGILIAETIDKAISTGEGQVCSCKSTGTNSDGEKIAEFIFTWSFKARKQFQRT
ncbi:MAG: thioesterase [Bacteroidetes bacterium]|nr:MAG: thioesterase [Bacteroidota bacterium]